MKMKWYELAKSKMKDLDVNQEKLAEHLGITKGAVSHWLNARREPSLDDIAKILRYLGMKEFTVNYDGTISSGESGVAAGIDKNFTYAGRHKESPKYPVISSIQAGAWAEAIEPYTFHEISTWLESDAHIQGKAFWLLVEGDSMTAPTGVSVPQGSYVLFDTGREAVNGSLVVAKMSDVNEATFKKLVIEGGHRYLKGLNPNWPIITINGNCKIIGVAVEAKMRFV